ncbi:Translin [Dacryopinax primogenitus]|uniref:Translin n=1 Tax=Dacryopinax primogenitus (strain DJM 731) TaxID=1858805 RepID=M5FX73_DACPD|nr:Translin [Dacryopinax primogenitus]EJU01039.1 Translin [Dacryopinax primogenitus]
MAAAVHPSSSSREMIMEAFNGHREVLDEFYDRREVLVKLSRDITALSKKCIFMLHRLMSDPSNTPGIEREQSLVAAKQGYECLKQIKSMLENAREYLRGNEFWKYQRSIAPGLQEFIEAYGFAYYLEHNALVHYADIQAYLSDDSGIPYFPLPPSDYLLGISDLTGELMRYAISAITTPGGRIRARVVCDFVRDCRAKFEAFAPQIKGLDQKQKATTSSLRKMEDATYAMAIREREYAASPERLDQLVSEYVSGSSRDHGWDSSGRTNQGDDHDE